MELAIRHYADLTSNPIEFKITIEFNSVEYRYPYTLIAPIEVDVLKLSFEAFKEVIVEVDEWEIEGLIYRFFDSIPRRLSPVHILSHPILPIELCMN